MVLCSNPSCGKQLSDEWDNCPWCGNPVLKCSGCRKSIQKEWMSCACCGERRDNAIDRGAIQGGISIGADSVAKINQNIDSHDSITNVSNQTQIGSQTNIGSITNITGPNPDEISEKQLQAGKEKLIKGDFDGARSCFVSALSENPSNEEAALLMSLAELSGIPLAKITSAKMESITSSLVSLIDSNILHVHSSALLLLDIVNNEYYAKKKLHFPHSSVLDDIYIPEHSTLPVELRDCFASIGLSMSSRMRYSIF